LNEISNVPGSFGVSEKISRLHRTRMKHDGTWTNMTSVELSTTEITNNLEPRQMLRSTTQSSAVVLWLHDVSYRKTVWRSK